jgi:hypothetical protein
MCGAATACAVSVVEKEPTATPRGADLAGGLVAGDGEQNRNREQLAGPATTQITGDGSGAVDRRGITGADRSRVLKRLGRGEEACRPRSWCSPRPSGWPWAQAAC